MSEIRRLTWLQVSAIYARKPQKQMGQRVPYRKTFFEAWRRRGLTDKMIERRWRLHLEKEAEQNKRAKKKPQKKPEARV
jgi:hypothetical protein